MSVIEHNVELVKYAHGRVIEISAVGKLTRKDYLDFVPEIDIEVARHGAVRMLFDFVGFEGWTLGALFSDTKFTFTHYRCIERLAIVGDRQWEKAMASVCKPFTKADVRFFDIDEMDAAKDWVREGIS